jgi:hypothetical protein
VARVVWSIREGKVGQLDAPELVAGYCTAHPVHEPAVGELLHHPDGSGPWRVIVWRLTNRSDSPGNVLVVEREAGDS